MRSETQHTTYSNIKVLTVTQFNQQTRTTLWLICIYILVKRDRSVFNFIFIFAYYFAIPVYILPILDKVLCI